MSDFGERINGDSRNRIRKMWDFPENNSSPGNPIFVSVWSKKMTIDGKPFNPKKFMVHKKGNDKQKQDAANVLALYQHDYEKIISNMNNKKKRTEAKLTPYEQAQIKLFLSLHSDKIEHRVQEINLSPPYDKFIGMNKPYNIYLADKEREIFIGPNLKKEDKMSREQMLCVGTAIICGESRLIADILGYLRPEKRKLFFNAREPYSKALLIHELAHTVANHVMFRPDDHHSDFYAAERLIKKFL
tara:strand:- start:17261 stop:17992 length:732 start_codon:yes stop_codon:yes gene_type:complete